MFKQTASRLQQSINKRLLLTTHPLRFGAATSYKTFSSSDNNNQHRKSTSYYTLAASAGGVIGYLMYQRSKENQQNLAEEKNKEEKKEALSPAQLLKKKLEDSIQIPQLLQQREQEKLKEYMDRKDEDITNIERGISDSDMKQMHELDKLFGTVAPERRKKIEEEEKEAQRRRDINRSPQEPELDEDEMEEGFTDEDLHIRDPYARTQASIMKHQEYRTIKVGPVDLLKNGQMIQVSVCDPFNDATFHPTDKVIIVKHNDKYYATGSFCGFDYTNLATGAIIGEKLICPTCGSNYNIQNGFVDQGPSIRNISSFLIQVREEKVQLIMPEHVPAFAKKKFIQRQNIDPRTFVVLGDSETALAVIDGLRAAFTGKIVVVPSSPYGQFENTDILSKKFTPIQKNEVYMVEEDYLDRANIDVIKGELKSIDLTNNIISVKGVKDPIYFDKVMVAWGSYKKRLSKEYSNVFYLEDRHSHARCHNELLKAKQIVVMGGTFEAYQTVSSIREYLDSINYTDVQIMLIDPNLSEVQNSFGLQITNQIHEMLREQRITVMMKCEITKIQGMNKIDSIHFKRNSENEEKVTGKVATDKNVEYFVRPDVVIAENGIGAPKYDIRTLLTPGSDSENGEPPIQLGIDPIGIPASDIKFSLHYNDLFSPILAAGSCTQYPSFIHKVRVRTNDTKYNIEAGFFAAMSMLDKRVEFRYLPMTPLKIGSKPIYYVGERGSPFHEIIINGSVEERKFVAYFVYGNEITGFMTCGYQNLHLYLWEAMKLLLMPPATQLRNGHQDYKNIVQKVMAMRPMIQCKRHDIVKLPSIMLAEFDHELKRAEFFRMNVKKSIEKENRVQKEKFQRMKQKYDRDGVEFIQDELELADKQGSGGDPSRSGPRERGTTLNGARKPGETSTIELLQTRGKEGGNINMGADMDNQKNPLSFIINAAKKTMGRD